MMELEASALQAIDEVMIDEQLQPVSHLDQDRPVQKGRSFGGGFLGREEYE